MPNDILKIMHWDQDLVEIQPFKPLDMPQARPVISSTQPGTSLPAVPPPYIGRRLPEQRLPEWRRPLRAARHRQRRPGRRELRQLRPPQCGTGFANQANQFPFGGGGGFNGGGGGFNGGGGGFNGGGGGFNGGGRGGFNGGGNNPFGGGNNGRFGPGGQGQQAALPDGVTRIFALQSNNSLLVQATVDGYNTVRNLVRILDVAPRQVQIKVEFVTASVTDVDNLGVNFDLVPYPGLELATSQGSSTISSVAPPTFLQYATGNIVAQLFQTLVRSRGKVVQAPLITTTNNVTATIQVNTQIPFFTQTVVANGGLNGGTTQAQQANFLTLQTGLTITPRINSDDSVTMNLAPQITDTTGQAAVGGIPPTIQQLVTTLRTVRSGDTMVLGGLVRKQESTSTQRIPILADIPILGGIFRTRNKQINDTELLIFVTPTIIGDSNDSDTANANGGQSVTVTP